MASESYEKSSLEDIAAQVASLEESIDEGEMSLGIDGAAIDLQDEMQRRVARAASELMTGIRGRDERQEFLNEMELFQRLLGAVAHKIATDVFREGGDSGEVKRQIQLYLTWSYEEMAMLDYNKRLEQSVERSKKRLALNPKRRVAASLGASAIVSVATVNAVALTSSYTNFNFTHEQQQAAGVAAFFLGLGYSAVHSTLHNSAPQVRQAFRNWFNGTWRPYLPPEGFIVKDGEDASTVDSALMEGYAKRQLEPTIGKIGVELAGSDIESEADIAGMVDTTIATAQEALYRSYGIDLEKDKRRPWYRRWKGWLGRTDHKTNISVN